MKKRVFILGVCPLPFEDKKFPYGPGMRTWQFVAPLVDDGHDVCLVCLRQPGAYKDKEKNNVTRYKNNLTIHSLEQNDFLNIISVPENDNFHSAWTNSKNSAKTAKRTVDSLIKHLDIKKQILKKEELLSAAKILFPELSVEAIHSYVKASKHIAQNHLGHFGLIHWPEISPRGVKDKAFIGVGVTLIAPIKINRTCYKIFYNYSIRRLDANSTFECVTSAIQNNITR